MPRLTNEEAFKESGRQLGLRGIWLAPPGPEDQVGTPPSAPTDPAASVNTTTVRIATIVKAFATG